MACLIAPGRTSIVGRLAVLLVLACLILCGVPVRGQATNTLVRLTGYEWRYDDSGLDPGVGWQTSSYTKANQWPSGTGLFGIESSYPFPYPVPLRTPLVLNSGRITYYFRTQFTFSGLTNSILLLGSAYIDDGAVFYLNGAEVGRVRMPAGPINSSTKAAPAIPEGQVSVISMPAGLLLQGANLLAVEVHQSSDSSSDVVFGMSLDTYTQVAPAFVDPAQPANQNVAEGSPVTLSVLATGFPSPAYQWYRNGVRISGANGANFSLASVGPNEAGGYYVVATNLSGSITSRTAAVSFVADRTAPAILYAIGQSTLTEILIVFSKPVNPFTAVDPLNWSVAVAGGGPELAIVQDGALTDGTNLVFVTDPRDASMRYEVTTLVPITDSHDNELPQGTVVPVVSFSVDLVTDGLAQPWRYNQTGSDLGSAWIAPAYNDATWASGAGPFDVWRRFADTAFCRPVLPEPSGADVHTCLSLSNAANSAQIPTSYFRTHFQFNGDPSNSVLHLTTLINDGAVFYLNGVELLRLGIPAGPVNYNTLANRSPGTPGSWFQDDLFLPTPNLAVGDNVLAVELHQSSLNSADLTFSMIASALLTGPPLAQPQLTFQLEGTNVRLTWTPPTGTLESAPDLSGPWSPVVLSNPPNQHLVPTADPQLFFRVALP